MILSPDISGIFLPCRLKKKSDLALFLDLALLLKGGKIDERKKCPNSPPPAPVASAIGPCPTILQISRTPWHWKLLSTFATPNHLLKTIEPYWQFIEGLYHISGHSLAPLAINIDEFDRYNRINSTKFNIQSMRKCTFLAWAWLAKAKGHSCHTKHQLLPKSFSEKKKKKKRVKVRRTPGHCATKKDPLK